jgi:hypothetical protein
MAINNTKKKLVTSFNNLSIELQEEVKALYPRGFAEVMTRFDKPNGDFFYYVPFETEDTSYLVKIDVQIDDKPDEAVEDDYYGDDELKGADEIQDDGSEDEDM